MLFLLSGGLPLDRELVYQLMVLIRNLVLFYRECSQGSVLGPTLFLLYINDINEGISSTMRLFADDSVVYRAFESANTMIPYKRTWKQCFIGLNHGICSLMFRNVPMSGLP